jgi:hypothetical protein
MPSDGRHYDPNQPRVPAGHARGGQWTSGEYGPRSEARPSPFRRRSDTNGTHVEAYNANGSIKEALLFNRDGSAVRSQYAPTNDLGWDERHTVRLPDGSIIQAEYVDGVQRLYDANGNLLSARRWGENGPEDLPIILARGPFPGRPNPSAGAALLRIFEQMARRWRGENSVVVLEFPASEYGPGESPGKPRFVGDLTEEQVEKFCKKYPVVKGLLADAVAEVRRTRPNLSPTQFGTAVHKWISDKINGPGGTKHPQFKDFVAEHSFRKSLEAYAQAMLERTGQQLAPGGATPSEKDDPYYSQLETVRVDVMEDLGDGTICVYDIKTGESILPSRRMDEIARAVAGRFPTYKRIIVIEARLGHAKNRR